MMTVEERIKMYKSKKAFIDNLSRAFELSSTTVMKVSYEVYQKDFNGQTFYEELIIVTYYGGSIAVKRVNGNSDSANLRSLAALVDGGYYDEVRYYEELTEYGFTKVDLEGWLWKTKNILLEKTGKNTMMS